MVHDDLLNGNRDEPASGTHRAGRWLALTVVASIVILLAGIGLSAYLYNRQIGPLTVEVERRQLESAKAQQALQLALAQIEQLRTTAEAEKTRLLAQIKEKSAETEAARTAADEASRKAAESERQRLALVQEKAKSKSDEATRIAEAQVDLKRAESALKQKAADIERQKQVVANLRDEKATQVAPEQREITLHALAGTWQGTLESKGKTVVGSIELLEHGKGLDGNCTSLEICDGASYTLAEASIQQNKVILVFKYIFEFRFDLTVSSDANSMEGTWGHGDMLGNKHSGTVTFHKT